MITRRAARLRARAASAQRRSRNGNGRGLVTIRHFSRLPGAEPAVNPPRAVGLAVDGNPPQGATSIGVRGTQLVGRFVAGDTLGVGDLILTVAADAIAVGHAATVGVTAALPAALTDGTPILPTWVNEANVLADIVGLGSRIPDGRLVQMTDLFLTVAAGALPWAPGNGDRVTLPDGDVREIVSVVPAMVDGIAISYRLQVR